MSATQSSPLRTYRSQVYLEADVSMIQKEQEEENMPEKKQESFTVTDRRLFTSDGEVRSEVFQTLPPWPRTQFEQSRGIRPHPLAQNISPKERTPPSSEA